MFYNSHKIGFSLNLPRCILLNAYLTFLTDKVRFKYLFSHNQTIHFYPDTFVMIYTILYFLSSFFSRSLFRWTKTLLYGRLGLQPVVFYLIKRFCLLPFFFCFLHQLLKRHPSEYILFLFVCPYQTKAVIVKVVVRITGVAKSHPTEDSVVIPTAATINSTRTTCCPTGIYLNS